MPRGTGIERHKAERVASVIFDAMHDNVATKPDVQQVETSLKADVARAEAALKAEIAGIRSIIASETARLNTRTDRLDAKVDLVEHRLLTRLGGLVVVVASALFGALHYWPPH
jgi:hypothetical protein